MNDIVAELMHAMHNKMEKDENCDDEMFGLLLELAKDDLD